MTKSPEFLSKRCDELVNGAGAAIKWVRDVRESSTRVNSEADGIVANLRKFSNQARRLGAAAERPMSVGFFGLSQAGKSYLISALAPNAQGELETVMDGKRLNFISHINPAGDGKEATGLVTRFTRRKVETPPGKPVVLTVFSEADIIKILGNSYFNDFDHQRVEFQCAPEFLTAHITALEAKRQPFETGGLTPEDVFDVMGYFLKHFPGSMKNFEAVFCPAATELAPYLTSTDRAELFSVLWGGIGDLTQAYLRFRDVLHQLGHPRRVAAPLGALVAEVNGTLTQADSIMNVDMLQRFSRDDADLLEVCPAKPDGGWGAPVGVPRSLLAGLGVEMLFELADPPTTELLHTVDLLDFPGYRGRLDVADLDDVRTKLEGREPVAELILRGKVAYLFERYTDDQEMNVLVLCTPSHKQSDVNDLGPALETWINSTQGETPEQRALRKAGLVWAITMFDFRLSPKPGETMDLMRGSWIGMMRMALLERFEQYSWVKEWTQSQPFNNIFLVRKRGMAQAVIETKGIDELGVKPEQQARLGDLRTTFLEDPSVQKHVADPAAAWDSVLSLNDGGIARLAAYLEQVALPQAKLDRIGELVDRLTEDMAQKTLGAFFRSDGADEVERKTKLAEMVTTALKARLTSFAELLRILQPTGESLRALYLRAESQPEEEEASTGGAAPVAGGLISLDDFGFGDPATGSQAAKTPSPVQGGRAARFALSAVKDWTRRLRQLPESPESHRFLGLSASVLQAVVDEVITAAMRYRIEEKLVAALHKAEVAAGTTRSKLADQQVLVAATIFNDFIDYLGFSDVSLDKRPASIAVPNRRIFAPPPPIDKHGLPKLTPNPINYSGVFIVDWFEAFRASAVDNAGHAAGSEISPEQNQRLGEILKTIAGAEISVAKTELMGA